jgi:multidrug efflux pump subunit AcrA (membrane-fusion protein)
VFLQAEGPVVYRKTLFGFDTVTVELGRRNDSHVEVLSGLQPGDSVSLVDPARAGRT